jgi:hypothetical protein
MKFIKIGIIFLVILLPSILNIILYRLGRQPRGLIWTSVEESNKLSIIVYLSTFIGLLLYFVSNSKKILWYSPLPFLLISIWIPVFLNWKLITFRQTAHVTVAIGMWYFLSVMLANQFFNLKIDRIINILLMYIVL